MAAPDDQALRGWTFDEQEISAGCYRITGIHADGRSVSRDGHDYDAVLQACIEDARQLPPKRPR